MANTSDTPDTPQNSHQSFSEFLATRRTTRDFRADPIAPEIIHELLTDALTAPSWSNTRPFKVAIASGAVRDRISGEFLSRWNEVVKFRNGNWLAKLLFRSEEHTSELQSH